MLSAPLRSPIFDSEKCSPLATRWLQKMKSMMTLVKRKQDDLISKNPQMAVYFSWDKTRLAHVESIKALEAKLKFFQEITSSGFNIEYSEIIRSHNRVQDILFDSRRTFVMRQKGLVEAWLGVKYEDAQNNINDFDKRRLELTKRVEEIHKTIQAPVSRDNILSFDRSFRQSQGHAHQKVDNGTYLDVCNQMRRTWLAWYQGLVHARAGRDYCLVFDNVIDKIDYPPVQRMCFGTVDSQNRSQRSIRNLVSELQSRKNLADEIIHQMEEVGCELRANSCALWIISLRLIPAT